MKILYLFFCLFLLFGCASSEKSSYDSLLKKQNDSINKSNHSSREITYLKNVSQFKEDHFKFITKQIKKVIKNYIQMKQRLVKIETKLDHLLSQQQGSNNPIKDSQITEEDLLLNNEQNTENQVVDSQQSSLPARRNHR